MTAYSLRRFLAFALVASSSLAATRAAAHEPDEQREPPPIRREFRAAWIATVANIDWPSEPGLPSDKQQAELIALLDKSVEINLNAVVLQVRPACDALYASDLEPWSGYLTGEMGAPPSPLYDPLEFAVEEAHKRGLQLHAWFNPYRASHPSWEGPLPANHIRNAAPEAVVEYGKYLWLDPSSPAASEHSLNVILDVVRRYDVDGVHFDDYFYPYPIDEEDEEVEAADGSEPGLNDDKPPPKKVPFPDDQSWDVYVGATPEDQRLSRNDWRRRSVNRFIQRVQQGVRREKPWVLFGVSPFGIWRPGHPESIKGFDPYEQLYADSRLWLEQGWVDYFTPQLYWPIRSDGQSYPVLLDWWRRHNPHGRHLWPGNFASRVRDEPSGSREWAAQEIVEQVRLTQATRGAGGNVHFSMKALAQNYGGVADALRDGPYAAPAVIPATAWITSSATIGFSADWSGSGQGISLRSESRVWLWAVQEYQNGDWRTRVLPGSQRAVAMEQSPERVVITAFDRLGKASKPKVLEAAPASPSPRS